MNIEQRTVGDVVVLSIVGNITMIESGAPRLADTVRSALQEGHNRLVLDLGHVPYVDSGGLGALVHAYSDVRNCGGTIKLLRVNKRLKDSLVVTKLLTVFDCFDQESDALASFEGGAASSSHSTSQADICPSS